jgi:hypothetical protein
MRALPLLFLTGLLCAQSVTSRPQSAGQELVTIETLDVQGTRFPTRSIETLTGLHAGLQINETVVRKAIDRMLESGLIKSVDYNYESLSEPGADRQAVALTLSIVDETPLLPASIDIPGVEEEQVWRYLESLDPLFTRELPRTQKALRFYRRAITDYLRTDKRQDAMVAVITGDPAGHATGIIFKPAAPRPLPRSPAL